MKKSLLFVFISLFPFFSNAQHQADKWFFGTNAALDFTSGSPVLISGSAMATAEGCSSIADASGNLLFYTDGVSVWNNAHTVMTNGTGLMGDISSSQSALIVPSPSNSQQYYIFTTDADVGPDGFRYSVVDMGLGAAGDVVVASKNTLLIDSVDEKITAIQDIQGGYWIVTHHFGNNKFYAYHLTLAGLQPPIVSAVGSVHSTSTFQNAYGQIKFNVCGDKLALAIGYQNKAELFDFDQLTGIVSNPFTIPFTDHVYGVEFSKTSTFLYITSYDVTGTLCQYNITLAPSAILSSRVPLTTTDQLYGMQLAPDGKIYVARSFGTSYLGVINSPDVGGFACGYADNGIDLDPLILGHNGALDPPGFVQSFLKNGVTCTPLGVTEQETDQTNIYPNPAADEFTLKLKSGNSTTVEIFDVTGKLMESSLVHSSQFMFGKNYSTGIYFVRILNGNDLQVKKIVKM